MIEGDGSGERGEGRGTVREGGRARGRKEWTYFLLFLKYKYQDEY